MQSESAGSTLCVGLGHIALPTNTNFWLTFLLHSGNQFLAPTQNRRFLRFIRECSSTLYVGMAHTARPTNTNFPLTFLLTRLQHALYEDRPV